MAENFWRAKDIAGALWLFLMLKSWSRRRRPRRDMRNFSTASQNLHEHMPARRGLHKATVAREIERVIREPDCGCALGAGAVSAPHERGQVQVVRGALGGAEEEEAGKNAPVRKGHPEAPSREAARDEKERDAKNGYSDTQKNTQKGGKKEKGKKRQSHAHFNFCVFRKTPAF